MTDAASPYVPISTEAINRVRPLISHFRDHEVDVEANEYDPVNAACVMTPLLLKNVFDPTAFHDALFFDVFAGMAADLEHAIKGCFRVYIDGMLCPRSENEALFTSPVSGESFREFVTRAVGAKRFGMIVNGAEQWSDPLARMGARVFSPIIDVLGAERSMIEVTLFIGNYGYTPFGVHIDDPYTSVVHFHLGLAAKTMTMFSKNDFHRLNGPRTNCFDPERLIPYGKSYSVELGDVFLLPPHWYHIGRTDDFSIGVAFAISKYPGDKMTAHLLQHAINDRRLRGTFEQVLTRTGAIGWTVPDWLRRVRQEHEVRTASRRWLRYSYARHRATVIKPETLLSRDPDFPLTTLTVDNDLLVFARGNHVRLERGAVSAALLDAIPQSPFTARDLHAAVKGLISEGAVLGALGELHRLGGLVHAGAVVPQ
ncbi:MAG: hypothetical protein ACTHNZ_19590 [Trinickia sp.]|uniref:hypothetical protein n=1 Tax=Trinickia sp. TaxID=2571163 RepID=UPI003F81A524